MQRVVATLVLCFALAASATAAPAKQQDLPIPIDTILDYVECVGEAADATGKELESLVNGTEKIMSQFSSLQDQWKACKSTNLFCKLAVVKSATDFLSTDETDITNIVKGALLIKQNFVKCLLDKGAITTPAPTTPTVPTTAAPSTEAPTKAPTEAPTQAPTEAPSSQA